MTTRAKQIIFGLVVILIGLGSVIYFDSRPDSRASRNPASESNEAEEKAETVPTATPLPTHQVQMAETSDNGESEIRLWQSPLVYFGKVLDEREQPIFGVEVSYSVNSLNTLRQEVQHTGVVKSDSRGVFKIDGISGIGAMVQLSHQITIRIQTTPRALTSEVFREPDFSRKPKARRSFFECIAKGVLSH